MNTLYIVSTPIGNLQDITLRAAAVLQSVPFIVTESTSKTANLLNYVRSTLPPTPGVNDTPGVKGAYTPGVGGPNQKIISFSEDEEDQKLPQIINLLELNDAALVSEAGTPLISDPGFKLVREAIKRGINVISIPGAAAPIAALTVSGLPTDKFFFVGYMPKKDGKRIELLTNLLKVKTEIGSTLIIFESPHRLVDSLKSFEQVFGDVNIVIARELTKIHEEVRREKVSECIKYFEEHQPKGEFVILI